MTIPACNVAIRNVVSETQAKLDQTASATRADFEIAFRAALVEGVSDGTALLVSQTAAALITIGREDGYPAINIPNELRTMLRTAQTARVIANDGQVGSVKFYRDFSGVDQIWRAGDHQSAAYQAWTAAESYRKSNT